MAEWKKIVVSGSDISQLLNDSGYLSGSQTIASASVAARATTLSPEATASIADTATTASHTAGTASIANFATTASHALNVPDTASHALTAVSSSFATQAGTSRAADSASVAGRATLLSNLATASFADVAGTARNANSSSTSVLAQTASVAVRATTLSAAATASFADLASDARTATSASIAALASTLSSTATASIADRATTASFADTAGTSRLADSASVAARATTLSANATASFADLAGTVHDGNITNAKIAAGTIANDRLVNDSVTIGTTEVDLGATVASLTGLTAISATTGTFVLQVYESSSTIITSGSNIFGNDAADIQQITGSIFNTGSFNVSGSSMLSGSLSITGSTNIIGAISASSTAQFSSLGVNTAPSGVAGAILATNDVVAFSTSDERLKENFEEIGSAVEKVEQITGYTFNWVPMEDIHVYGDMKDVGVKAQDVEKVLPELVSDRENGYKAVKYDKLTALLIECVKSQQIQIQNLEKQIAKLSK